MHSTLKESDPSRHPASRSVPDVRHRWGLPLASALLALVAFFGLPFTPLLTGPSAGGGAPAWLGTPAALAQHPHIPREGAAQAPDPYTDPDRAYQRRSVEGFGKGGQSAMARLKQALARIQVTPAQFFTGLGVLGLLFTWNKNKKKAQWAALSTLSLLLVLVGAAALFFRWPAFN